MNENSPRSETPEGLRRMWSERARQRSQDSLATSSRSGSGPSRLWDTEAINGIAEVEFRPTFNATEHSDRSYQEDVLPADRQANGGQSLPSYTQETGITPRQRTKSPPQLSAIQSLGSFGLEGTDTRNGQRQRPIGRPPRGRADASVRHMQQNPNATGFAALARQIVGDVDSQKEQALLRLYAAVSQDARLMQADARSTQLDGFYKILEVGLPQFIKAVAAVVLRTDKGTALLIRKMASAVLKALARWIEACMSADPSELDPLVSESLDAILLDGSKQGRGALAGLNRNSAEDGFGNLLDTDALEGLLDGEGTTTQDLQQSSGGLMDTQHMFGSLMESGTLEKLLSHNKLTHRGTTSTQMISTHGSLDMTGHILKSKGALRALLWLFKSDLPDAWYTAASLVGSIAMKGIVQIDAMGGPRLIKPLMWLLRQGGPDHKLLACRALAQLAKSDTCSHIISQRDKHLKLIAQVVRSQDVNTKLVAIKLANALLSVEPGTHWILSRCGLVASLISQLKDPTSSEEMRCEAVNSLKHLTSASQHVREEVIARGGVKFMSQMILNGSIDAQYNSARVVRHLAMSGEMPERIEVLDAIPALVEGLKGRPRVSFACSAALAMLSEGTPSACSTIQAMGGIPLLVDVLNHGGTQGKKVAAEALQALAAEDAKCRQEIYQTRSLLPLVHMLAHGSLQQRAAAAGAIQALAVRTSGNSALPPELQSEPVVHYVINIMHTTPRPMQCATAGVVCNLASGLPEAEALMSEDGAIEVLTDLLSDSQPDGQYSAAASLANLSVSQPGVLPMILDLGVLPPLFAMLEAKSWYCRIVAADLLLRLSISPTFSAEGIDLSVCMRGLLELLHLQKISKEATDQQVMDVAHLAYERSHEVIVMKGYRFHRAKMVATLAIGHLCFRFSDLLVPDSETLQTVLRDVTAMLASPLSVFGAASSALIADLCRSSSEFANFAARSEVVDELIATLRDSLTAVAAKEADALLLLKARCSARALLDLCERNDQIAGKVISQGLLKALAPMLQQDWRSGSLECTLLLRRLLSSSSNQKYADLLSASNMSEAEEVSARSLLQLSSSSILLHQLLSIGLGGYAVSAKPSANLYILLQIPFEVLIPTEAMSNGYGQSRLDSNTTSTSQKGMNGRAEKGSRHQEHQARMRQATLNASLEGPIMETWNEQL